MQKTFEGLPLYSAEITENDWDTGINLISLVEFPAVERNFVAFGKEMKYTSDGVKRMVFGLVMGADSPIYRRDSDGFEYYVVYSRETLEKMAEKMFRLNNQNNVDTEHSMVLEDGVNLVQFFIKDSAKGIVPEGFSDVPDGSLFAQYHITRDDLWEEVEKGTFKGFSLMGYFNMQPVREESEFKNQKMNKERKNILCRLIEKLLFESVITDKGTLVYEGNLEVGTQVNVSEGDGNISTPEDGEYKLEDGTVLTIESGAVKEIKEPETSENQEETSSEPVEVQNFRKKASAYSESYSEKMAKIDDAVREMINDSNAYSYVLEAGDDYAVAEIYHYSENGDSYTEYLKYNVSWDENGNCTLSDPVEVVSKWVDKTVAQNMEENLSPEDELKVKIAELEAELEAKKAEIEELKKQLEDIQNQPSNESAVETFRNAASASRNDARFGKLVDLLNAGK